MMRPAPGLLLVLVLVAPVRADDVPSAAELAGWVKDLADPDYAVRQAATERLVEAGPAAIPTLFAASHAGDGEVRFRVRYALETILRKLEPAENRVRAQVRDALDRLTSKGSFGTGDPEYMEIVDVGRPAIGPLVEILSEHDQDHVKRIYAGAALAQVCQKEDVPRLLPYLSDGNVHVRIHVGSAMNQLTGQGFDYDSSAGPENWSKAKEKYQAWWAENSERILRDAREEEAARRSGPSTRTGGG